MILVVERDPDLSDVLCFLLRRNGDDVVAVEDADLALQVCEDQEPEAVILDIDFPGLAGWHTLRRLRMSSDVPVIVLCGGASEADIVKAFELGADDCMVTPISPRQLLCRLRVLLRRATDKMPAAPRDGQIVSVGDLRLNPQWRQVDSKGRMIQLTAVEFKLLYELAMHEGQVLTHQWLGEHVWGYHAIDGSKLLKGHIRNLRKKLERDPSQPEYLQTIVGVGYSFISSSVVKMASGT